MLLPCLGPFLGLGAIWLSPMRAFDTTATHHDCPDNHNLTPNVTGVDLSSTKLLSRPEQSDVLQPAFFFQLSPRSPDIFRTK